MEPGSVMFYELASLGTACEFGLSLMFLYLSQRMSRLVLNTNILIP